MGFPGLVFDKGAILDEGGAAAVIEVEGAAAGYQIGGDDGPTEPVGYQARIQDISRPYHTAGAAVAGVRDVVAEFAADKAGAAGPVRVGGAAKAGAEGTAAITPTRFVADGTESAVAARAADTTSGDIVSKGTTDKGGVTLPQAG